MAGCASVYVFVGWIRGFAAAVTHGSFDDAGDFADDFLHAPETTAGEDGCFMCDGFGEAGLNERVEILAIASLVQFFDGNELQGSGIDAATHATLIARAIVENMAEMRIGHFRADLG